MGDTVEGNVEIANSIQLSKDLEGYDTVSKDFLKNKEVLAVILQEVESMTGWGRYIYEDGECVGKIVARYEDGMEPEKIAERMQLTVEKVKEVLKEKGLLDK